MSSELDHLRAQVHTLNQRVETAEGEVDRAYRANKELEKEAEQWKAKYEDAKSKNEDAARKAKKQEDDFMYLQNQYEERYEESETLKKDAKQYNTIVQGLRDELQAEKVKSQRLANESIQMEKDLKGFEEQHKEQVLAQQARELQEMGTTFVNALELEQLRKDSGKYAAARQELDAIERQLEHYVLHDLASRFPHDSPSRNDLEILAPAPPGLQMNPLNPRAHRRTVSEELVAIPPTEETPEEPLTTTIGGLQSTSPFKAASPVRVPASTQTEEEALEIMIGGIQTTAPAEAAPSVDQGVQVGAPTTDSSTQTSTRLAITRGVQVPDPSAQIGSEPLTMTIGGVQSTAPIKPISPVKVTTADREVQAGSTTAERDAQTVVTTNDREMQAGGGPLTITIGGRQSTAPVGGEPVKIIETIRNRVIHHHSFMGCFWTTARNMIIITRKVAQHMPTSFTNPVPGFVLPGIFRGLQQGLEEQPESQEDPPLLAIMKTPDIVEMPLVWQTLLDFFSYLSMFFFLYQCYLARAWVTEMMAHNGIYRSYFFDLYTHHDRESRGVLPTFFSEGIARFVEQFTLALVRHFGIEIETYPMPG